MSPPLLKFLLFIYFSQRTYLVSICMLCPHLPKTRIHPSRGARGEEGGGGKSIPPPPSFFYVFFLPKEHIFLSICMPCTHLLKTGIYPSEGEGAQEHLFFPPPQVYFIHFFFQKNISFINLHAMFTSNKDKNLSIKFPYLRVFFLTKEHTFIIMVYCS